MLTLSESFDDEGETKEGKEDAVQFLEAGEDAAVAFEPSEEAFDLVPFAIERQGSTRLDFGGTTGTMPSSSISCRVSLPS